MADVDVSELLNDPDFVDTFVVMRNPATVDATGRLQQPAKPVQTSVFGVVQPASGRTLSVYPDLTNVGAVVEVWTTFGLQVASDKNQPDHIIWDGNTYVVNHVDKWTNFSGFVHAVCTMQDVVVKDMPL